MTVFKKATRSIVFLTAVIITMQALPITQVKADDFSDVPSAHWAYPYVNLLRELNITDGIGNNMFGVGNTITRAEFAAFLCKLMDWQTVEREAGSFVDNQDKTTWYYPYIETALARGALSGDSREFFPLEPITREDIAVMLVRALGYEGLANQLSYLGSPFSDVTEYTGHITIARDLGIVSGMESGLFMPKATAAREQAATILAKMHKLINNPISFKNGFYAISSAGQMAAITDLNSICFGWARLTLSGNTVSINTTTSDSNEYYLPSGYEGPLQMAAGKNRMLMIAVDNASAAAILSDPGLRSQAADIMANAADSVTDPNGTAITFDGIVVDFEGLKGSEFKSSFNSFLAYLDSVLEANGKLMYVAVHPARRAGHEYYDGYDYKTIGDLADKVILMAHDYNTLQLTDAEMEQGVKMTPMAPIDEVYYGLKAITDRDSGVQNLDKIVLQISFDSVQWKLTDGKVINSRPYRPSYDAIVSRIQTGAKMEYSDKHESPYITFQNNEDGTDNIVWYEDVRSVSAKIELARLFGVSGISVWRLGIVPDYDAGIHLDVLGSILKYN